MKYLKNISTRNLKNPSGLIILVLILVAILAILIGSHDLATAVDLDNIYLAPFESSKYILGTDALGRSVVYGLMNGIKVSLIIGVLTGMLSLLIGLFFSYLAGYLGNDKLLLSIPSIVLWVSVSFFSFFYLWYSPSFPILLGWMLVSYLILVFDKAVFSSFKKKALPLDTIIMKVVELIKAMPGIFLILFIFALFSESSLFYVIGLISFIRIPSIVRLARSEVLKVKNQEYILAAEAVGIKTFEIFRKHIFPNIFTPLKTYFIYTVATTILIESTLSFLGLGLPLETVSLGSMLSNSRDNFSAWWLAILPGGVIFLMIISIRKLIGQKHESADYLYL